MADASYAFETVRKQLSSWKDGNHEHTGISVSEAFQQAKQAAVEAVGNSATECVSTESCPGYIVIRLQESTPTSILPVAANPSNEETSVLRDGTALCVGKFVRNTTYCILAFVYGVII